MKIAITGGAGFIASHIVDAYINQGAEVFIFDNLSTGSIDNINPKAKFFQMDIADTRLRNIFLEEKFDAINHHAAQMDVRKSVADPIFDANTNIIGALNVFESAFLCGAKKIIFSSSGGTVYGEQDYFPADEFHKLNPCSPYGVAKLAGEKYLEYYASRGLSTVIFRYANIYGPRQNSKGEAGVVAIFCEKLLNGETPIINGDGNQTRDYVFIEDVVKANLLALREDCAGIFNIGTGIESTVNQIFRVLASELAPNCPETHAPAKIGEQYRSVLSFNKINQAFNWEPKTKFADGLKITADYFKGLSKK